MRRAGSHPSFGSAWLTHSMSAPRSAPWASLRLRMVNSTRDLAGLGLPLATTHHQLLWRSGFRSRRVAILRKRSNSRESRDFSSAEELRTQVNFSPIARLGPTMAYDRYGGAGATP